MNKNAFTQLYERHQEQINDVHRRCEKSGGEIIGPYLIDPHDSYLEAEVKVVFVGQDPGGWETSYCDVPKQMACYRNFNLNGRVGGPTHPGPYWDVIRDLELALIGKTHACAALNMNRFSEDERRPCTENLIILSELDFLLLEELKLLHPDVVIFLTGPDFETRLNALLQPLHKSVADFTLRQLSRLESHFCKRESIARIILDTCVKADWKFPF